MKFLKKLSKSRYDGRIVAVILLVIFSMIFVFVAQKHQVVDTWRILGVKTAMLPYFADLRVVLAGAECQSKGIDPLIQNPCDKLGRILPYPRVWPVVFGAVGLDQRDAKWLGPLFGICFLMAVFLVVGKLNLIEGAILGIIILSPPILFAIERANIDLVIFCISFIGGLLLVSNKRSNIIIGVGIILLAAVLKYYSIFSLFFISSLVKVKEFALIAILIFIAYLLANLSEFFLYNAGVSKGMVPAFGIIVLSHYLKPAWFDFNSSFWNSVSYAALSTGLVSFSVLLTWIIHKSGLRKFIIDTTKREFIFFCIGASVFVGCYLSTTNYDYRLIFLLFCLPQFFLWQRSDIILYKGIGYFLSCIMVTSLLLSSVSGQLNFIDEWLNLILFFSFSIIMLLSVVQKRV